MCACESDSYSVGGDVPGDTPVPFMSDLAPAGTLIHSGVFSLDLREFYYTISDRDFTQFDVYVIDTAGSAGSQPKQTFFNSEHNEHGTSFSPDGRFVYFSSTRPVPVNGVTDTWHIWRSEKLDGQWREPEFVDIPNMRDRLVSHPSVSNSGTLYFHSGNPDYSELMLYAATSSGDNFNDAVLLPETVNSGASQVTPFVAPDESYLLFERESDLYISNRDDTDSWSLAVPLNEKINSNGKGNPFVTPDGKFLFYVASIVTQPRELERWSVYRVSTASFLDRN